MIEPTVQNQGNGSIDTRHRAWRLTHSPRNLLLAWAERGHIAPSDLPRALALAGATPTAGDWRRFLDRLLLWLGTVMVAAGLIFFLAYNWNDMGRFGKFGLAEALIVLGLLSIWRFGLDGPGGKAALLAVSLFTGALLALIGQTYQTGADTFELFAAWAVLILPWVLTGRFPALWILWLGLCNLAAILYIQTFGRFFGGVLLDAMFGKEELLWLLFVFNTAALALWEALSAYGLAWLRERWATRLLATVSGVTITTLVCYAVADRHDTSLVVPIWAVWMIGAYFLYRRRTLDGYVLTGGVLSLIVVTCAFLIHMLDWHSDAGALLFIGLIIVGLSGVGGWWLKHVLSGDTQ